MPAGQSLAVSLDTLVAGRHFPNDAAPEDIATRAFCVCLSDLAAMGATPQCYTLGLTLPDVDPLWLAAFSDSLHQIASRYDCQLIGGDTTKGPLTITLQVHGIVPEGAALRRSSAQVGDQLYVTNTLGDGAAALQAILGEVSFARQDVDYLTSRFYQPEPQITAGIALAGLAHAAIDISDGLLADLAHIARASRVDMTVDVDQLPLSAACLSAGREQAIEWALTGGDDYQLAFTVPAKRQAELDVLFKEHSINATLIGTTHQISGDKPTVRCQYAQQPWQADNLRKGFDHFAS